MREDILASQPIWEAEKLKQLQSKSEEEKGRGLRSHGVSTTPALTRDNAPGLALLVGQVLRRPLSGDQDMLAKAVTLDAQGRSVKRDEQNSGLYFVTDEDQASLRERRQAPSKEMNKAPAVVGIGLDEIIAYEDEPLTPELASLPVTKALVRALEVDFKRSSGHVEKLEDVKLSRCDFTDFIRLVLKSTRELERGAQTGGTDRARKVALASQAHKATFDSILLFYLMQYYNSEFVDRNGGSYKKLKIGLTITNETITSVAGLFVEALFDYAILGLTATSGIRVPIVYVGDETTATPPFVNAGGSTKTPTLAAYVMKLHNTNRPFFQYVVEPVRPTNRDRGISAGKLEYIRYASGLAADQSEALTGMIVRALGGAELGFVAVFGKLSIGDNQTLVKLIDTFVEGASRRLAEIFTSTILYEITTIPDGVSVPEHLGRLPGTK